MKRNKKLKQSMNQRERETGTFNIGDENWISYTYQSLMHSKHIKINLEYANPNTNIQNIGISLKIILTTIFKNLKNIFKKKII